MMASSQQNTTIVVCCTRKGTARQRPRQPLGDGHLEGRAPGPDSAEAEHQHRCLDKAFDLKRVEAEVRGHRHMPHILRAGVEQWAAPEENHPARRWVVERTFGWLKGFRAIRTRYIRRGKHYLVLLHLACALVLSRRIEAIT
ncbi:MAG: transposase [Methylococcaceae bacterium]|nr:transposase [Methylococcaceae bacterium]